MYGKLALRNLFRNRVRTFITLLMIGSGSTAMVIAGGFIEDTVHAIRESTIRDSLGHLRISKKGFLEKKLFHPYDYLVSNPGELIKKVRALPHVRVVGPRLDYCGLIGNGELTLPFFMQAFDPALEDRMRNTTMILSGRFITSDKPFDVMVGEGLAHSLNIHMGDGVVLLGNTQRGAMNAMDISVTGAFRTILKDVDNSLIRAPITVAQKLLQVDGAQYLIVFLDQTENVNSVRDALLQLFKKENLDYEVQVWRDIPGAEEITNMENMYRSIYRVMKWVLFLFVILAIMNTMNMAVLERIGEIGTLMALGTERHGILKLFLAEGVVLGLLGGLMGCIMGCVAAFVLSWIGIQMPKAPGSEMQWVAHIKLTPGILSGAFLMAFFTSLISSILPALKASKLEVAEALRHNI